MARHQGIVETAAVSTSDQRFTPTPEWFRVVIQVLATRLRFQVMRTCMGSSFCCRPNRNDASYVLWQNCVTYPPNLRVTTVIYGDTPTHIVIAEVVDRKCVGGIWFASAHA
jgi:hypothetical protein